MNITVRHVVPSSHAQVWANIEHRPSDAEQGIAVEVIYGGEEDEDDEDDEDDDDDEGQGVAPTLTLGTLGRLLGMPLRPSCDVKA